MEIGKVVEVGEREITVTPAKRETTQPVAPVNVPEREREREPS